MKVYTKVWKNALSRNVKKIKCFDNFLDSDPETDDLPSSSLSAVHIW